MKKTSKHSMSADLLLSKNNEHDKPARNEADDDPAYKNRRDDASEVLNSEGRQFGYGSLNIFDYIVPDRDPDLEYMAKEPESVTLTRYIHNRKKVYFWEQVGILFGAIATLFGAGAAAGGNPTALIEGMGFLGQGLTGVAGIFGITSAMGAVLCGAAICGVIAFGAGYYAFRTDIKNDVDLEEMQAKRTGMHVANKMNEVMTGQSLDLIGDLPEKEVSSEAMVDLSHRLQSGTMKHPGQKITQVDFTERLQGIPERQIN